MKKTRLEDILLGDPMPDGPQVVAEVRRAGRPDAGKDALTSALRRSQRQNEQLRRELGTFDLDGG